MNDFHALQLLGLLLSLAKIIGQLRTMIKAKAQEQELKDLQMRLKDLEEKIRELTDTQHSE